MIYTRNPYTGSSKKKIVIRVIIVIASLIAVSAATFAFGNYLKAKAEATTVYGAGAGRSESSQSGVGRDHSANAASAKGVKSACVPLSAVTSADEARDYVDKLATKGFTGVTVILVGRDGYLTYTSSAVAAFTKQRAADVKDPAILSAITAQAKKHSMTASAVIFPAEDYTSNDVTAKIDSIVVADAVSFGFDEIAAILPLDAESLDSILAASAVRYLTALGETKGDSALGAALPFDVYDTPRLSPQVELFSSVCDFLAIDLSEKQLSAPAAEEYISKKLDAVEGYFAMYELRAILDGSEEKIANAEVKALADGGYANYMFVTETEFTEKKEEETTGEDDGGGGYDPSAYTEPTVDQPADNTPVTTPPAETAAPAPAVTPETTTAPPVTTPPAQETPAPVVTEPPVAQEPVDPTPAEDPVVPEGPAEGGEG